MFELFVHEFKQRRTPQQQHEWLRALEDHYGHLAMDEVEVLLSSRTEATLDVLEVGKIQPTGAALHEIAEDKVYRCVHFPLEILMLLARGDRIYVGLGRDEDGHWEALYVSDWSAG